MEDLLRGIKIIQHIVLHSQFEFRKVMAYPPRDTQSYTIIMKPLNYTEINFKKNLYTFVHGSTDSYAISQISQTKTQVQLAE